jgi:hypothetical protein
LSKYVNVINIHNYLQVQLEPTTSWALLRKDLVVTAPSKYTGMFQASKDILREEGLKVVQIKQQTFMFTYHFF